MAQAKKKKVAIIGSQGVPAKYGGFETLVENIIGENCSPEIHYTIFCSGKEFDKKLLLYKGAVLKYVPFRANGIQSTIYDIVSLWRVARGYDTVLLLGISGCIILPLFRLFFKKKLIINIDGLEHKRGKWGRFAKQFLRLSESLAVRYANIIITDNKGIQNYVLEKYRKKSSLIAYGGDHVIRDISEDQQKDVLKRYGIISQNYSVKISRIEPENNCGMILEAFSQTGETLVYIGNWERNIYSKELKNHYDSYANIHLIESVYDLDILFALRRHCKFYIHGHSAGGTNPSLVEAMFFGCPILAFDCIYNKETTEYCANYFKNKDELISLLSADANLSKGKGSVMLEIANRRYKWEVIKKKYESLY